MLFTLLHRAFKFCSIFELFHHEIDKWKIIFENNGYPKGFVDFCLKKYLDKVFIRKEVVLKVSKKERKCVLPFIGKKSLQLRIRLVNSVENNLKLYKLKVAHMVNLRLAFTEWFFYNLIVLIKLYKIRYLNSDKALLFLRNQVIYLKNWKSPTTIKFNSFCWYFAHVTFRT